MNSIKESGKILASVLSYVTTFVKPGITTKYLDEIAEKEIIRLGAIPAFKGFKGYPATLCTSVENEVVHTIPDERILQNGQILTLDCGVNYEGFFTDSALTIPIGEITPEKSKFIGIVRDTLYGAIRLVKPAIKVGVISNFIQTEIEKAGYHIIKDLIGHGIGRKLHQPPEIPNFGKPSSGASLVPGMTFCIEPIAGYSSSYINTLPDGWTIVTRDGGLAAQQEHTILVTETGFEILTLREEEKSLFL